MLMHLCNARTVCFIDAPPFYEPDCGKARRPVLPAWRPVEDVVITQGHSDHARVGHARYLAHDQSEGILRSRLGEITLQTLPYGEPVMHNGVRISLHPAGHVLGSAQIRVEYGGEVWAASGDYKFEDDGTCSPLSHFGNYLGAAATQHISAQPWHPASDTDS